MQNIPNIPLRAENKSYRSREYLTSNEIKKLLEAVKNRNCKHPQRDYALVLLMFRHALRPSEAINLRWDVIMFERQEIFINRLKGSEDKKKLIFVESALVNKSL